MATRKSSKSKASEPVHIDIQAVARASTILRIIGTTPLIQNRMPAKVKRSLLLGSKKKTAAEKAHVKHHPFEEFRDSIEFQKTGTTAVGLPVTAVKGAMLTAALETAGMTKTGAQRLLFMPGDFFYVYGVPQIRCDVVRSADMGRTPDIRTRAIFPHWCAEVEIEYVHPQLSQNSVAALLSNAGMLSGVGDYRQEKGKGSFGSFRVVGNKDKDKEWASIVKMGGRAAQEHAILHPEPYNYETEELLSFYNEEIAKRAA